MIEKRDVIGLGQGYLGTIVLFIDGIKGFPVTNTIYGALRYVGNLGGLI